METSASTYQVQFTHSNEKSTVDLDRLVTAVVEFLELYGEPPLGEVDFGPSCQVLRTLESGDTLVRLHTHTLEEYRAMDPDFEPPPGVTFGEDGHPIAPIRGIMA